MEVKTIEILNDNEINYENLYKKEEAFLRYPAGWVTRFHNMYMKKHVPNGRVLDFGCGSGNNSMLFLLNGYSVFGCDVGKSFIDLVEKNLKFYNINDDVLRNFRCIENDIQRLPYRNNSFDCIISNQVLYYLGSKKHIKHICNEFDRILKSGGVVFFTMMSSKHYYICKHSKNIHDSKIHEISIDILGHRLNGVHEVIYVIDDEHELMSMFDMFDCLDVGYFDQKIFDLNGHHYIFIGKSKK